MCFPETWADSPFTTLLFILKQPSKALKGETSGFPTERFAALSSAVSACVDADLYRVYEASRGGSSF